MIRENKYLVTKWSDIEKFLTDEQQMKLHAMLTKIQVGRLNEGKQPQQYVVVAADWPMYETVWGMIENFVDGTHPAPAVPECGNCFEGKSDMDHVCRKCGGTGRAPDVPEDK